MKFGHIIDDPAHAGQFKTNNTRPAFKACVAQILGPLPAQGANICHSVCFKVIGKILCDIVNNYQISQKNAWDRAWLFDGLYRLCIAFGQGLRPFYPARVANANQQAVMQAYEATMAADSLNLYNNINLVNIRQFFSHMNSSPFNLRYPVNLAVNWNQSVGEAFDPIQWCYFNGASVTGDNTALTLAAQVPWANYAPAAGLPAPAAAGLYILNRLDHYFLNHMVAIGPHINQAYLYMTKASDQGAHYLPSSSNAFPIPQNNASAAVIYYLNTAGQWAIW